MAEIVDLYAFLAVLIRGASLALEATTIGGIIFLLLVLQRDDWESEHSCVVMLRISAASLGAIAILGVTLSGLVLSATEDGFSWATVLHTSFFRSGLLVATGSACVAMFAAQRRPLYFALFAAIILAGSLMASHAFARVDERLFLLMVTGLHHLATAAWIGGLPYLVVTLRRQDNRNPLRSGQRFSKLAIVSVAILIGSGATLSFRYIGDIAGLYGTSYGAMLASKFGLLGLLLLLGRSNYTWLREPNVLQRIARVMVLRSVEIETAVGITAILAAASLTSQPPAIDLTEGRVTLSGIWERVRPQWPSLSTPPLTSLSPATPLNAEQSKEFGIPLAFSPGASYTPSSPADIAWSEYNHHWAGLCVFVLGVFAMIAQTSWGRWARHWPLVFFGLATFLLVRADPENWPLGPRGFWESFQVAEVAQHRVFVALICVFAIFEWRVATGRNSRSWHALIFPSICLLGGALLLTHTHSIGNVKEELLAELSHIPIAILAVIAGGARWLQLRLPQKPVAIAFTWASCFVLIGVTLLLYREG